MIGRGLLAFALLAAVAYSIVEMRRWRAPATRDLISDRQKRLRLWGFVFLFLCLALFLGGTFLPDPHTKLAKLKILIYWTVTVLCAVPLIPLALLDARENLLRLMAGREQLARQRRDMAHDFLPRAEEGPDDDRL